MLAVARFELVNNRWIPPESAYFGLEGNLKMASWQLSVTERVLREIGCGQNLQLEEVGRGTRPFVSTGGSLEVPYSCWVTDIPELFVDYEVSLPDLKIIKVDFRAAANGCSVFYFKPGDEAGLSICEDIWKSWLSIMRKSELSAKEVDHWQPEKVETVLSRRSTKILRKIKNILGLR